MIVDTSFGITSPKHPMDIFVNQCSKRELAVEDHLVGGTRGGESELCI